MDDLISRRAAIDALVETFKRIPTTAIRAKNTIEQLPFAQPEAYDSQKEVAKYVTAFSDGYDRGKADAWIPYSVCDLCIYNPPSSMDGKPCSMCVAQDKPKDPDSWSYS